MSYMVPWSRYSKKLSAIIAEPRYAGILEPEDGEGKGMRFLRAQQGDLEEGSALAIYVLIDEEDGVIADVKYQVYGQSALIGAMEALAHAVIRKSCTQLTRLTADLLDRQWRDHPDQPAFPPETFSHLNGAMDILDELLDQCRDLMIVAPPPVTPVNQPAATEEGYEGWELLDHSGQMAVIEEVIASDIRPYIELDEGGIQIVDLVDGKELYIAYQGACTSCHSSTGATLSAIQGILRAKVHPAIVVIPDASFLH